MLYVPRALTAHSKRKTKLNGISEAAFDFVEPLIKLAWPQWKGMDRYGVTRIAHPSCLALINELRGAADNADRRLSPPEWLGNSRAYEPNQVRQEFVANPGRYEEAAALFRGVAEWLESAMARYDGRPSLTMGEQIALISNFLHAQPPCDGQGSDFAIFVQAKVAGAAIEERSDQRWSG